MKVWLVNLMWDALRMVSVRAHDWVFDPDRAARNRMAHRERWWDYRLKAGFTKSERDDRRAEWWRIHFNFKTPPGEAGERGDLEPYRTH